MAMDPILDVWIEPTDWGTFHLLGETAFGIKLLAIVSDEDEAGLLLDGFRAQQ